LHEKGGKPFLESIVLTPLFLVMVAGILAVLVFDITNGFHDASNMIATLVASRSMTPAQSVALVGIFTFLGPVIGGTAVANTIGGFVDLSTFGPLDALGIVCCGISGAISWNLLTWRLSIPSSSSHALVGALVGAVLAGADVGDIVWGFRALADGRLVGVFKVLLTLFVSPVIGFAAGYFIHHAMNFLLRGANRRANILLRRGQWLTAAALAFAHGTNDAQKGMGIITMVLVLGGALETFQVPIWVVVMSAISITTGTLMGGWRIVRTVGFGIYKLRPLHGFDAQLASSAVIFGASLFGGPVSTTHVVSSSIMGIGASERPHRVHWNMAREIMIAWLLTLPGAAVAGAAAYALLVTFRAVIE
jgi:PiT family inorganic phosphate transporter